MPYANRIFDMHCHLDFADECEAIAAAADEAGVSCLDATVTPSSFVASRARFAPYPTIDVSLGLHPWWIANNLISEVDIARFETLLSETDYIGEVGLDYSKRFSETWSKQLEVLYRVFEAIESQGGHKLITLHAVRAYRDLFTAFDRTGLLADNACIFHWFSGTRDDFGRALSDGCYFSVSLKMMASEKGEAFARAIPNDRLLIESDAPAHEGMPWSIEAWKQELDDTVRSLADLRGTDDEEIASVTTCNAIRLLTEYDAGNSPDI